MAGDKESTKQKLINAVGEIIIEDGFKSVGINSIARKAKVDKVLIYRYFDSLEGLLEEYIKQKDYYVNLRKMLGDLSEIDTTDELIELSKKIFIGQLRDILKNKELLEILLWELNTTNKVTETIAREREKKRDESFGRITESI